MAGTGFRIVGLAKLRRRVRKAVRENPENLRDAMVEVSAVIEADAKKNIRGSRTRALRAGRQVTAPSNVLGIDFGILRSSITFAIKATKRRITSIIGPQRVKYGAIHEFGGVAGRGARIPARPYLGPAVEKNRAFAEKKLGSSFKVVS